MGPVAKGLNGLAGVVNDKGVNCRAMWGGNPNHHAKTEFHRADLGLLAIRAQSNNYGGQKQNPNEMWDPRERHAEFEFDSYDAALADYISPEYQQTQKLQAASSENDIIVTEGVRQGSHEESCHLGAVKYERAIAATMDSETIFQLS